jgi:hypothetical protein
VEVDLGWDFWVDCGLAEKKRERERQKIKNSFFTEIDNLGFSRATEGENL